MNKKTSVLLVDSSGKENRLIQIPTKVLFYWKRLFLILSSVILILITIISVFIYQKTSDYYKEKLIRANKIRSLIDLEKVKHSFQSIDESMFRINKFLEARGLEGFQLNNVGGLEEDLEITDINTISDYYENKIINMEHTLNYTPIGSPVLGDITSYFGLRDSPFRRYATVFHAGLDFRGKIGAPIKATAKGVVVFAGNKGGYGKCIIIKHNNQFQTLYGHLSKINVKLKQKVIPGQLIGELGNTGKSTGPHLHYEVLHNNKRIDPKLFLNF